MGVRNILRVHDSIGKCFENDLCKLCGCNSWRQTLADAMRLKQQLTCFFSVFVYPTLLSSQGKVERVEWSLRVAPQRTRF